MEYLLGGDLVSSKATVCIATESGKKAALGIHEYCEKKRLEK